MGTRRITLIVIVPCLLWSIFVFMCYLKMDIRQNTNVGRPTSDQTAKSSAKINQVVHDPTPVKILVWSSYFRVKVTETEALLKQMVLENMSCLSWCHVTGDLHLVNESDALVWHGCTEDMVFSELPSFRNPRQPWVWWFRESPYGSTEQLRQFNGIFNWTMTYRHDSDIVYSYGRSVPLSHNPNDSADREWLQREAVPIQDRTKLAVAVISNCDAHGKRQILIQSMIKHGLPVDIYGNCGFPVKEHSTVFWGRLQKTYKFYLAFENALCTDYITEKLWRTLSLGILPVVYGGGNYTQVAPPNSFINARDFNSTKQLVAYLKMLAHNDTAYAAYFEWRKTHRIEDEGAGFCYLCEKIRDGRLLPGKIGRALLTPAPRTYKQHSQPVYDNLYNWWMNLNRSELNNKNVMGACSSPEHEFFMRE